MNPTTLLSLGLPALVAWSLLDDFEKARIKRGLSPTVEIDEPDPIEYQYDYRPAQTVTAPLDAQTIAATVTTPEPPKPKTFEERKARLIEVLGEHNLTPIWELRNAPLLWVRGWQRSGKTTKAQTLHLLRQLENIDHPIVACSPHKVNGDSHWPKSFRVSGMGNEWNIIRRELDTLRRSLEVGNLDPGSWLLDEFSGYAQEIEIGEKYIQALLMSAVREFAKHKKHLTLITHGSTMAMTGGVKGLSQALLGNFTVIECSRKLIDGKPVPGERVQIFGGGYPEVEANWPQWFDPEWLLENFPELQAIVPKTLVNSIPTLGRAEPVTMPESMPEDEGMEPHLKAIVDYITRKGEATPRQIQTAKLKPLTDSNNNKIEAIQLCLDTLIYEGILEVSGLDTYRLVARGNIPDPRVEYPHSPHNLHSHIHSMNPHPENI